MKKFIQLILLSLAYLGATIAMERPNIPLEFLEQDDSQLADILTEFLNVPKVANLSLVPPNPAITAAALDATTQNKEAEKRKVMNVDTKKTKKPRVQYQCQFPGCNYQDILPNCKKHILATHTIIRPYKCPARECKHATVYKKNLETHILQRHTDQPGLHIAELSAAMQAHIDNAIAQYLPHLPYKCQKCPFSFETELSLLLHNVHLHDKPYRLIHI